MLGRSNPATKTCGLFWKIFSIMSLRVALSAVAVSPIVCTMDNSFRKWPNSKYSFLKSCPHWDTQWASSMAKREMFLFFNSSIVSCLTSLSGAAYNIFSSFVSSILSVLRFSWKVLEEFKLAALMPKSCSWATCDCISAIKGETTTVMPLNIKAGSW